MFRIIQESEIEIAKNIYQQSVKKLATKLYSPIQIEAWSNFPNNQIKFQEFIFKPKTYIKEENNQIIAFCGLEENGHIASLYVHPNYSRQGYGTEILKFVLTEGQNIGLEVFHTEASFLSQPLFLKCGFKVITMETVKYGEISFERYKMQKNN